MARDYCRAIYWYSITDVLCPVVDHYCVAINCSKKIMLMILLAIQTYCIVWLWLTSDVVLLKGHWHYLLLNYPSVDIWYDQYYSSVWYWPVLLVCWYYRYYRYSIMTGNDWYHYLTLLLSMTGYCDYWWLLLFIVDCCIRTIIVLRWYWLAVFIGWLIFWLI